MTPRPHLSEAPGRVIFINRFYWPEELATAQLLTDLAESLAASGLSVLVITGRVSGRPHRETFRGVDIIRVRSAQWGRQSVIGRGVAFASFWLTASQALLRLARASDVLVPLTDPPLIGVSASWIGRWRGARVFHWIQDIYPEVAQRLARRRVVRMMLGLLIPLRDRAWSRSEACVVLGNDMAAFLSRRGVPSSKVRIIRNWAPAGIEPSDGARLCAERGLEGQFVIAYSGNLGRVHGLESIVAVAEALRPRADIVFAFIGDGPRRRKLQQAMKTTGAQARFFSSEPRARLSESLAAADLHLVTLAPEMDEVVFPSKFIGALSAGRPVLFIGPPDSELARLIRREELGLAFAPDDVEASVSAIARLADEPERCVSMGQRALAYSRVHATQSQSIDAWRRLLQPAVQSTAAVRLST